MESKEPYPYKVRQPKSSGGNKPGPNSRRPRPQAHLTVQEELAALRLTRLQALSTLETKLSTLKSNFELPASLTFQPSSFTGGKLAFTPENAPFLAYEDALTSLLIALDGVESGGMDEIRMGRKKLVREIEEELVRLDGIWKTAFEESKGSAAGLDSQKDLSQLTPPTTQTPTEQSLNPTSSKRLDEERGRGSPISGGEESQSKHKKDSNGSSKAEDRFSKLRKRDPEASTSDSTPLMARLPSRFD